MPECTTPMENKMTITVGSEAHKKRHAHKYDSIHNQYTEQNVEVSYIQITLTYFEDRSSPIYAL
jgi:hypothetical protein